MSCQNEWRRILDPSITLFSDTAAHKTVLFVMLVMEVIDDVPRTRLHLLCDGLNA